MGNSEGSQVIPQVFTVRKNRRVHLTDIQMQMIVGSVLGDAYIYPKGKICFEQSSRQKDYLHWKYGELKELAYPKIAKVIRVDKRSFKKTVSYRFFLRQFFRPLREVFYHNGKIIPLGIDKWLTPLLLAVWYMDDGHLANGRYPLIATENYQRDELNQLMVFLQRLELFCRINHKNRLIIKSKSKDKFFHLITPYIHPSLRYKLP